MNMNWSVVGIAVCVVAVCLTYSMFDTSPKTTEEKATKQKSKKKRSKNIRKKPEVTYRPVQPKCDFLQRELLPVPNAQAGLGFCFTIMSYNVLAQALVKRLLYPHSGEILRWKKRYDVIKQEIRYYNPTILCMQEVDVDQLSNWSAFFLENGYHTTSFDQYGKRHCLLIAYKHEQLSLVEKHEEQYENIVIENIPQDEKKNGALVNVFRFSDEICEKFPYLAAKGLIIGTTHLYWLPLGCFDRTRQCYRLLQVINEIRNKFSDPKIEYLSIAAGDFNTEPHDAPYQLMTTKADASRESVVQTLASSLLRSSQLPDEVKQKPDKETKRICQDAASALVRDHCDLATRAISLYSIAHGTAQEVCEPDFTNWTPNFKGTLDYIFALLPHKPGRQVNMKNCAQSVEQEASIRPVRYLALPTSDEMTKKNVLGLPKLTYSPSDHFSVMVEVELIEQNA